MILLATIDKIVIVQWRQEMPYAYLIFFQHFGPPSVRGPLRSEGTEGGRYASGFIYPLHVYAGADVLPRRHAVKICQIYVIMF